MAGVIGLAAVPAACFPSYTYDLGVGGTGTGSGSSSSGTGGDTGSSTSTSTGMSSSGTTSTGTGGTTTTTSSSSTTMTHSCSSADCSDPACTGAYLCVPTTPPSPWTGYFALYDGASAGVPSCSGQWPTQSYAGNGQFPTNPPQATCPCSCGAPTGGTCVVPELDIGDATCGSSNGVCTCPMTPPSGYTAGNCFNMPASSGGFYVCGGSTCGTQTSGTSCTTGTSQCNVSGTVGEGTVTGSSCAPSATNPMKPPVPWGSTGQACGGATAGTGCGTGSTCMPVPQGAFHSGVCIMQPGVQTCPPGQFSDTHVFYTGVTDSRGCTACTCGAATGDSCTVTWHLYSDSASPPSCQTQQFTMTSGTCSNMNISASVQISSAKAVVTTPPNGGACAAVNGTPTGTVAPDPAKATTFCCIP